MLRAAAAGAAPAGLRKLSPPNTFDSSFFASPSTPSHDNNFGTGLSSSTSSMSQYFQRIRESVAALVIGTNRGAKRSAQDNDTDPPAPKRRCLSLKEALLAVTDGTAEFRRTFEGQPYRDAADEIRTNDPSRTTIHLGFDFDFEEGLSDDAARLMGRYISTNKHLTQLQISNGMGAEVALFEGLRGGSLSLTSLDTTTRARLSEQLVQAMLPFLRNTPKLKALKLHLGSASFQLLIRALNGRSIEYLSLRDSDLGDISSIGPCNLTSLTCLELTRSRTTSIPPLLGFPELRKLFLSRNKIDKEGFARLNEYLAGDSCQLEYLYLCDTGMEDEDISSLARALEHNRSIIRLQLEGNTCGATGYMSILKTVLDISTIKATLESNTCLHGIRLPKENAFNLGHLDGLNSDSDENEYISRDGFEAIRNWIHSVLRWNRSEMSPRVRMLHSHLNTRNRRQLCEMQGVDYSYDSLFAEIHPCLLPELFATLGEDPADMDPIRALIATVASWTSLVDRRLMVEATLEKNRAQVKQLNDTAKQLNDRNEELEEKLKDIDSSNNDDRLSGSKRPYELM